MTTTSVLVLGAEGMLGHKVLQTAIGRFHHVSCTILGDRDSAPYAATGLFPPSRTLDKMNAMDFDPFAARIRELKPDFLVNCIGIVKQRDAATAPIPSIFLNALLPHKLVALASSWGGRVIHFSTDCVFSGRKGGYTEDDPSDAEDLYGRTKFLGEVADENALTLRTSIIGRELSNFASLLEWFLAQQGKTIKGFARVIYSGVTTNYLADLVCKLMAERPTLHGLFHVAAAPVSKLDLLRMLKAAYRLDVEIVPEREPVCDRSMVGSRFVEATGLRTPPWEHLIEQLAGDTTPYHEWRLGRA